jgi:TetR/AcrR family transcriptional regulator, mexJK operon transcriptional repressor
MTKSMKASNRPTRVSNQRIAGPHSAIPPKILDAATDLFFEQGYERVTVDAIVAKAGGSKSNVYKHFGGKEGLLFAVVERESAALRKPLDELDVAGLPIESALKLIARVFLSIIYADKTIALHRLVIAESGRFPDLASIFLAKGPDGSTAAVARLFKAWQRSGVLIASPDANILARQFLDLVKINEHSRLLLGLKGAGQKQYKRIIDVAIRTFLSGTRAQHRSPRSSQPLASASPRHRLC